MRALALVFLSIALGAAGQILLKRGMQIFGQVSAASVWAQLPRIFMVPQISIGFLCFASSAILWLVVISRFQLSYVYPMVSLTYIVILFVSAFWFREPVNAIRVAGVALICLGVVFITRSSTNGGKEQVAQPQKLGAVETVARGSITTKAPFSTTGR